MCKRLKVDGMDGQMDKKKSIIIVIFTQYVNSGFLGTIVHKKYVTVVFHGNFGNLISKFNFH